MTGLFQRRRVETGSQKNREPLKKKIKLKRLPPTTKVEAGIFLYSRPFGGEFKLVPNLEAMSKNGLLSQTGLR